MRILQKLFGIETRKDKNRTLVSELEEKRNNLVPDGEANQLSRGSVSLNKLPLPSRAAIHQLTGDFFAFDVETTGLDLSRDRIVEFGIVKFQGGLVTNKFNCLVNPGFPMPQAASAVNNITDALLADAPCERDALERVVEFLGDSLKGKSIICAHNADFDMGFLSASLARCGYNANIVYVDTLFATRRLVKGLVNHRLDTVISHFGIRNEMAHRATQDAEACGHVLLKLIELNSQHQEQEDKRKAQSTPSLEELEVCAFIYDVISRSGGETDYLRFSKNSSKYVSVDYLYSIIKFKFAKSGRYILVPKTIAERMNLPTKECTTSEGGSNYLRVFFNAVSDIHQLEEYIISSYRKTYESYAYYKNSVQPRTFYSNMSEYVKSGYQFDNKSEVHDLLRSAAIRPPIGEVQSHSKRESVIHRSMLSINPQHNRKPLDQIHNRNDWSKGFQEGSPYYFEGEELRKSGYIETAISLFDKARYYGYNAPALYWSYAIAYRMIKDYENEIAILDECIDRLFANDRTSDKYSQFDARRNKAMQLLYKLQNNS